MKKILLACLLAGVFSLNSQTHNCGEDNIVNIQKANLHNYDLIFRNIFRITLKEILRVNPCRHQRQHLILFL
ncbi:MAG: hypothetical protein K0S32_1788 [Bacteroidetes bacterium]|nr:hypothetical protein [Bacteroidota bacterium]